MIKIKRVTALFTVISMMMIFYGCQNQNDSATNETNNQNDGETTHVEKPDSDVEKPVVSMTMENGGKVEMELDPHAAPNTVNNFIALIEDGFYDGLTFHRVISDFMIQGGDPEGTGQGGPGYAIKGEFSSNGFDNDLTHEPGVISMARTQDPDSAGSQFFIVTGDASQLDGDYAAFGKVVSGMDVVEEIESTETDDQDKPTEDQIIDTMTVELNGYDAEEPNKVEE